MSERYTAETCCQIEEEREKPSSELVLRRLSASDVGVTRVLCEDCFPLNYPDRWYQYILSNKVYSRGLFTPDGSLLGIIIAEEQPLTALEGETGAVLDQAEQNTTVMYIISLGVSSHHRQCGLGSRLVNSLLTYVSDNLACKAVYLHVLATNTSAINFYDQLGFVQLSRIPSYYVIDNSPADGLLYCRYSNGGARFSGTVSCYLRRYVFESWICLIVITVWTAMCALFSNAWKRLLIDKK